MCPALLRRFRYTIVTLGLALVVLVTASIWQINAFQPQGVGIFGIEETEIGEVLFVFGLVIPSFFLDRLMGRQTMDQDKRVHFALAVARMGVWEWDLISDGVTWSSTTAQAFGLSPEDTPTSGQAFIALVHPDDRQVLAKGTDRALRDGTDLASEFRIISSDGLVRWVQTRGRILHDSAGKPVRVLGVNIDITDRKLLEQKLRDAQLQAEQLRVLRVTMRTVQDIVNNSLNQLQLLRMEADGHVSEKTLATFDQTIQNTAAQLTALGDMEAFAEKPTVTGSGLDVGAHSESPS